MILTPSDLTDDVQTVHAPGQAATWRALKAAGLLAPGGWATVDELMIHMPLKAWSPQPFRDQDRRVVPRGCRDRVWICPHGRDNVTATLAWLRRKDRAQRIAWDGPTYWRAVDNA